MWQLVGAVLAIANLWSAALALAVFSLFQAMGDGPGSQAGSMSLAAAAFFFAGCLCVPSAYYALCRLLGWTAIDTRVVLRRIQPMWLALAFPALLGLGYLVSRLDRLSWVFLPPIHLLAISLPVLIVLYLGVRRLPLGSSQRLWGVFDSGLVLGPGLILVLEMIALLAFVLLGAVVIASQPELVEQIMSLAEQMSSQSLSEEDILQMLGPILQRPAVILAVLVFAAVLVPLIEEFIKPVGAWLLAGRRLNPAEGFAAGALSGAGYALFESLTLSGGGESWMWVVLGRAGTAVLHITTSGLVGWALVQTWSRTGIFRFGLAYLGAVLVHGAWNAVVVLNAYLLLSEELQSGALPQYLALWNARAVPILLVLFAGVIFAALVWANRKLAKPEVVPGIGPTRSDDQPDLPAQPAEAEKAG